MKEKNKDITIVVNSFDLYEDAWYPFFKLLTIQWPQCNNYDIVLISETKEFNCDFLDVRTYCGGKGTTWSKLLKDCLKQIDTEFVLFFLEDQFLRRPVDNDSFQVALDYMKEHTDVGVIIARHSEKQKEYIEDRFFSRDLITNQYRISAMSAIYRKDFLKKLLRSHENPWEFEVYASIRSKRYKEKVLQYNNRFPEIFVYDDHIKHGYGITMRKWMPKNKPFFEDHGIEVDFERIGIMDWETWEKLVEDLEKTKDPVIKTNLSFGDKLHSFKKVIKKAPQKFRKTIRRVRSLI